MTAIHTKHPDKRVRLHQILLGVLPLALIGAAPAYGQAPPNDECDTASILDPAAPLPPFTDSVDATTPDDPTGRARPAAHQPAPSHRQHPPGRGDLRRYRLCHPTPIPSRHHKL